MSPRILLAIVWMAACSVLPPDSARAQLLRPEDLPELDAKTRAAIVDSVTAAIDSIYVLLEPAKEIVAELRSNLAEGEYDEFTDPLRFAQRLHDDCQAVRHDGHFGIRVLPPLDPELVERERDADPVDVERERRRARGNNYGFRKAEILPGGVGYLRFDQFGWGPDAFAAATAAMNFVSNANAIILDLRNNGGGSGAMIRFLAGYLLEESEHLISWEIRAENFTRQSFSADYVPGQRSTTQPLYILVSGRTFSAAEEFSFDMKNLERATLVGETTGGGGHTVAGYTFAFDGFRIGMRIPYGRAYNPETNEGWEGVGVVPHVEVPAGEALEVAHAEALRTLLENEEDEGIRAMFQWALSDIESERNPLQISTRKMQEYVGQYGPRRIYLEGDTMFYRRDEGAAHELAPLGEDLFRVGDLGYFRVGFERDDRGRVVRIVGHYDDGRTDGHERDGV